MRHRLKVSSLKRSALPVLLAMGLLLWGGAGVAGAASWLVDYDETIPSGTTRTEPSGTEIRDGGYLGLGGTLISDVMIHGKPESALYTLSGSTNAQVTGNVLVTAGGHLGVVYADLRITGNLDMGGSADPPTRIKIGADKILEVLGSVTIANGLLQMEGGSRLDAGGGLLLNGANAVLDVGPKRDGVSPEGVHIQGNLTVTQGTVNIGNPDKQGRLQVIGNADFQAGSTLSLHAASGALDVFNNLSVADGAKLVITGGAAGDYNDMIKAHGTVTASADAWTGANLSTTSLLLGVSGAWNGSQYVLTVTNAGGGLIPGAPVDPDSPNAGVRFHSRAYDTRYNGGRDRRGADAVVEGAAELAQIAAVPGLTMAAANAGAGAVIGRTSFAAPVMGGQRGVAMHRDASGEVTSGMSAGGEYTRNGLGLWLMPLYQNNHVWGMTAGNFKTGYNSSLGGIAFGADYTFQEMFRIGASFNVGGGYAKSSGDLSSSENFSTFWGVNLYGGLSVNNFGLGVEGGYTGTYNQLRQDAASAFMPSLEANNVYSRAWHAGLRAEYRLETPALDIIPHAGVRWIGIHLDGYNVKGGGGTVFKVDDSYQSIWTFPVGVTFAKTFSFDSGWSFKPQVDAGVIPAAGDVKSKARVRIPGVAGSADLKVQQVDYTTFDGTAGFEVANGKGFSIGLNYNLQLSEHRTGHGVFGTLRYEF